MSTLAEICFGVGAENRPPMLEKEGLFQFKEITIPTNKATRRVAEMQIQTLADLTSKENTRKECDIEAANIIL
ncbi:hypothetical protein Tco_0341103 [Tanacetum coccineum]